MVFIDMDALIQICQLNLINFKSVVLVSITCVLLMLKKICACFIYFGFNRFLGYKREKNKK